MNARLSDFYTKDGEHYSFTKCPTCGKYPKVYITERNSFYAEAVVKCSHFLDRSFYVKVIGPPGTFDNDLIKKAALSWNDEIKLIKGSIIRWG